MSTPSIDEVLKQLNTLSVESGIEVFIPSLQRAVKFKALNLKQQKGLLKSSIDESLTKLAFNNYFYDIIRNNVLEQININNFYTFDRTVIAMTLRAKGLDSNLTIQDKTIDLNAKIESNKSVIIDQATLSSSIEDGNILVNVKAPTLGVDKELNEYAALKTRAQAADDFKTTIGELFVYELIKFIQRLSIKSETGVTEMDFSTLKTADKVSVVENLPSTVTNKILDFVRAYREVESKFTDVDGESIDVTGSFFTV